jgi:hypothetical protein
MKIGCIISILLLRSNLSCRLCLGISEQNETRKRSRVVVITFVDHKLFLSLEVSNTDLCRLEASANPSVHSVFWVDFLWVCPTSSDIVSWSKVAPNMARKVLHTYYTCFLIFIKIHCFGQETLLQGTGSCLQRSFESWQTVRMK